MSAQGVTCPECSRALKFAVPVAAGKMVKCPGCGTIFAAPARTAADNRRRGRQGTPAVTSTPSRRREPAVVKVSRVDDRDDDRPRRRRPRRSEGMSALPFLIGGGVLAAVLLVGGTTALLVWLKSRDEPPPAWFQGGGTPVAAQQALIWQQFISPDAGYMVFLPGRPTHRATGKSTERDLYMVDMDNGQSVFSAGYFGPVVPKLTQDELYTLFRRLLKEDADLGKCTSETPTSLDGIAAMEFELSHPTHGYMVCRMCLVKGRPFMLAYEGRRFNASSSEVQEFFRSFRMTGF